MGFCQPSPRRSPTIHAFVAGCADSGVPAATGGKPRSPGKPLRGDRAPAAAALLLALVACLGLLANHAAFLAFVKPPPAAAVGAPQGLPAAAALPPPQPRDTLVLYVFAATDPEYINNLRFFVDVAIDADDRCEYVIVVQDPAAPGDAAQVAAALPRLPPNARYVHHENSCYDWCGADEGFEPVPWGGKQQGCAGGLVAP